MDPSTAVSMSPAVSLMGFAVVIFLLLFLIAKWKWHVFFALLVPILLFGVLPGVQQNNFIDAFESGFGNTLGSIGVVIVLGSIIAEALKHTGAIQVITRSMVNLIGSNRMPLALTLTGFVIGVAIFSDVAFVILNPLVHSAAKSMGVSIAVMSTGLVGALQLTHAIVPPTPGPLAAAALVGADIGKTIIFGSIACLFGSLSCWAWGVYVAGPRIKTQASDEFDGSDFDHFGRRIAQHLKLLHAHSDSYRADRHTECRRSGFRRGTYSANYLFLSGLAGDSPIGWCMVSLSKYQERRCARKGQGPMGGSSP